MKKTFLFLAICLAMTMAATSCGDFIETSDNGDLDGYWQLSQVDTLANGVQVDMTSSKVFWGCAGQVPHHARYASGTFLRLHVPL